MIFGWGWFLWLGVGVCGVEGIGTGRQDDVYFSFIFYLILWIDIHYFAPSQLIKIRSNITFGSAGGEMDGNRKKWSHLQCLERLRVTVASNQRFEKNLLIFQRFETFAVIIPLFYAIIISSAL